MRDLVIEKLRRSKDLPSLPEIIVRLEKVLHNQNSSSNDVARIIESDPVLTGKILKIANSVFYSSGGVDIKTIPMAIVKLGFKTIRDLTYSINLTKLFVDTKVLNSRQFWYHSLAVGVFARVMAGKRGASKDEQELTFLSGIMHDIGIMVFCNIMPVEYIEFLKGISGVEQTLDKLEDEKFSINHAELGALFIENSWQIDKNVILAVRLHHFPFMGNITQRKCSQFVNIANGICNSEGISNGVNAYLEVFKEGAWQELGFTLDDVDDILSEVKVALEETNAILNS